MRHIISGVEGGVLAESFVAARWGRSAVVRASQLTWDRLLYCRLGFCFPVVIGCRDTCGSLSLVAGVIILVARCLVGWLLVCVFVVPLVRV